MSGTSAKAKDAAVREAASLVTYLAIVSLVSLVVLKRYYLIGAWQKLTARRMTPRQAAAEREVADFRRELAQWDHPGTGRPRGLYEGL